jgi:hypothetical protein
MISMEKIYDLVNRENGASTRCSEKYIFQWLARGYEVESFVFDEPPKTKPIQVRPIMHSKAAKGPHLSSNNVEYISRHKPTQQEAVNVQRTIIE